MLTEHIRITLIKPNNPVTIGEEKECNPRLGKGKPLADFVGIIENLNLPYPKKLDVSLPANLTCGTQV